MLAASDPAARRFRGDPLPHARARRHRPDGPAEPGSWANTSPDSSTIS